MGQKLSRHTSKYTPGDTVATVSGIPYDVVEERRRKSEWTSINSDLVYRPIRPHQRRMRVLQVLPCHQQAVVDHDMLYCRLLTKDLDDDDLSYTAVSYVWGDPAKTETIIVEQEGDDAPSYFKITKNLHSVLKAYEPGIRPVVFTFWIDGICINQADDVEKSQQVRLMTAIYSRASSVWAWLGSEDTQMFQLFFFNILRAWGKRSKDTLWPPVVQAAPPSRHELLKYHKAIHATIKVLKYKSGNFMTGIRIAMSIFFHSYFQRIWTQQEVLCNDEIYFLLDTKQYTEPIPIPLQKFREFLLIFDYIIYAIDADQKHRLMKRVDADGLKTMLQYFLGGRLPLMLTEKQSRSLLKILARLRTSQQPFDQRDNVFGVLGFASNAERLDITIDYAKSTCDVFTETAEAILVKEQDLSILSYCSPSSSQLGLPSWVPDWSYKEPYPVLKIIEEIWEVNEEPKRRTTSAARLSIPRLHVTRGSAPVLVIDGYRVTVVKAVGKGRGGLPEEQEVEDPISSGISLALYHMRELSSLASYDWLNFRDDEGWRTLTCTISPLEPSSDPHSSDAIRLKSSFTSFLTLLQRSCVNVASQALAFDVRNPDYAICAARIADIMRDRITFVTETGFIGVGPAQMRSGDIVCIFLGGNVPYILRQVSGEYILVGECFIYRMMFGEEIYGEAETETFHIR